MSRFGTKRGSLVFCILVFAFFFILFALGRRVRVRTRSSTLVFQREDIQRIWEWEIKSGHYPSHQNIPPQVHLKTSFPNPAIPPSLGGSLHSSGPYVTHTRGTGSRRVYHNIEAQPAHVAYPPRPIPGSVADLDVVMEHCDFSTDKYVRDCLEFLRVGAGLDNGRRVRRGPMDNWKYIYSEENNNSTHVPRDFEEDSDVLLDNDQSDSDDGLVKKRGTPWEIPPIPLPEIRPYRPYASLSTPCDPDRPRIFHMFWAGEFTDKPYLGLLSFLFTQNVGLHHGAENNVCRPQLWLWINPGPAASVHNPRAREQMHENLRSSPWAAPFLHPRFKDVIKFKLWNTTEQLDGIEGLKDEWRTYPLFNSGGHVIKVPKVAEGSTDDETSNKDDMLKRSGSKSVSTYDRLSVILSDMARFILVHRFGGIYLDADTIFLRDWEELWGWRGAFAYRWSRLPTYNTAVLKMNKNSALGRFLFRTALKNKLDFHPMEVAHYTKHAFLEPLLLRLPDALFDSAWLNTEQYQMDRPPQPFLTSFEHFFDTPLLESAAPQALGFEGFFRGAYSYHFHNFWWKPFDATRNWPDLGPRFEANERKARGALKEQGITPRPRYTLATNGGGGSGVSTNATGIDEDEIEYDERDLPWATVLKRTFESYMRGERPNMYGEWLDWEGQ